MLADRQAHHQWTEIVQPWKHTLYSVEYVEDHKYDAGDWKAQRQHSKTHEYLSSVPRILYAFRYVNQKCNQWNETKMSKVMVSNFKASISIITCLPLSCSHWESCNWFDEEKNE